MMENPNIQIMAIWINSSKDLMMDEVRLRNFLDDLVQILKMTVILPTIGVRLPIKGGYVDIGGNKPNEDDCCGYSFVTLISESHIAIHTWPLFGKAFLDIVSCKEFGEEVVNDLIIKYFPESTINHSSLRM